MFVSSTWLDLQPERRALMDALNHMDEMRFVGMEFFGNRPETTHEASLDQVEACEVFILVIGSRYGSGITAAEYRQAQRLGLPCFVYFKSTSATGALPAEENWESGEKLAGLKQELMANHTVKEFASPADLAVRAAADLHNWVASRWISLEAEAPPPSAPARPVPAANDRVNLLRLVERVHTDWIGGVLDGSLHRRAWMDLGLDWRDDAVEHPWDRILVAPNRPVQTLAAGDSIAGIFAAAQNTLLILGEPGAGKTTTLLELARDLVRRVRESPAAPAPVVLALSTWTGRHRAFPDWVTEELNVRYQVPKRLAQVWLADDRLVLLLDGLDEVQEELRGGCVRAINAFAGEHSVPGLAVSCRVTEYSALAERLRLRSAICLQPLTAAQIDRYFSTAGAGLETLCCAMQGDRGLRELAQTPLMLSVMTMAWRDAPPDAFAGGGGSVELRRRELLDAYVQAALRRKGGEGSAPQTLAWLTWLARQMRARGQTLFAVEQLQPDWLEGAGRQSAYFTLTRLLAVLMLGLPLYFIPLPAAAKLALLMAGIVAGAALAMVDFAFVRWGSVKFATPSRRVVALAGLFGLLPIAVLPSMDHFAKGLLSSELIGAYVTYCVLIVATTSTLADIRQRDIRPADAIGWSWRQSGRRAVITLAAWQWFLVVGFFEYVAVKGWGRATEEFAVGGTGFWTGVTAGTVVAPLVAWRGRLRGWRVAAAVGACASLGGQIGQGWGDANRGELLGMTAFMAFLVGLFGGLTSGIDETRARRTGAWFWVKVPLLAALTVGSVVAVVFGGIGMRSGGWSDMAQTAMIATTVGGIFGLVAFFRFGGFQGVQHFILCGLLTQSGRLPKNPTTFLDHAVRLHLMQKVGFGYRFVHALLLDHFADRDTAAAGGAGPSHGRG